MFTMIFYLNGKKFFEQRVKIGAPIPRIGEHITVNHMVYSVRSVRHDYGASKNAANILEIHFDCN